MKYCAYLVVTTILCCISFVACSNEEEKFENIKFKTTGITLSKPSGTSYYAEIGSAGGIVTITSIGKNAKNGFLSQIKVGNYYYSVTDNELKRPTPYTICEEDWGKIEILSTTPHSLRMTLKGNKTSNSINYELTFGGAYKTSTILLTQLRNEKGI